jgi:O-methyltransferase involved in polyketide biosynthesis
MTPEKIHFTKEKETMLMMLNGRAIQSQWKDPILRDPWAAAWTAAFTGSIRRRRSIGSTWITPM